LGLGATSIVHFLVPRATSIDNKGVNSKTLKASRDAELAAEGVEGVGNGEGVFPPQLTKAHI